MTSGQDAISRRDDLLAIDSDLHVQKQQLDAAEHQALGQPAALRDLADQRDVLAPRRDAVADAWDALAGDRDTRAMDRDGRADRRDSAATAAEDPS